eukprot:5726028-Prymnesium_polylepis.1
MRCAPIASLPCADARAQLTARRRAGSGRVAPWLEGVVCKEGGESPECNWRGTQQMTKTQPTLHNPSSPTAGPRRALCRYRESGLNFHPEVLHLPVTQIQVQGQI